MLAIFKYADGNVGFLRRQSSLKYNESDFQKSTWPEDKGILRALLCKTLLFHQFLYVYSR